jgi:hypothetical protein
VWARTVRLPGAVVRIEADHDPWLEDALVAVLGPFLCAGDPPPDARIRVRTASAAAELEGVARVEVAEAALLPCAVEHLVCRAYIDRAADRLALHAAVLAWDRRALVFPAGSQAGKSTLALALLADGWTYLSDDVAPLDPAAWEVAPFPRLLHLRPPTLALLPAASPHVRIVSAACRDDEGHSVVLAAPLAPPARSERYPVAAVIFPRYLPAEPAGLARLPAGVAAVRLLQHTLNGGTLGTEAFRWAIDLARRVPAYALTLGALEPALVALRRLLDDPRAA